MPDQPNQLVILVPVLGRPHRVEPLLESIVATTIAPHRVLFLCSSGDLLEIRELQRLGCDYLECGPRQPGDYARKINTGYRATTEPLLFLGADDLLFYPYWFETARRYMRGKVGVVGTNDLGNPRVLKGRHSTHSLVSRAYIDSYGTIDEDGKVLHEGYDHVFCDDELIATARHRRAFAFAVRSVVEHLHPHWKKGILDDTYRLAERSVFPGRELFQQRRHLWGQAARVAR